MSSGPASAGGTGDEVRKGCGTSASPESGRLILW
jgi:hypothetical protein